MAWQSRSLLLRFPDMENILQMLMPSMTMPAYELPSIIWKIESNVCSQANFLEKNGRKMKKNLELFIINSIIDVTPTPQMSRIRKYLANFILQLWCHLMNCLLPLHLQYVWYMIDSIVECSHVFSYKILHIVNNPQVCSLINICNLLLVQSP